LGIGFPYYKDLILESIWLLDAKSEVVYPAVVRMESKDVTMAKDDGANPTTVPAVQFLNKIKNYFK